jgi:hypothetical protein
VHAAKLLLHFATHFPAHIPPYNIRSIVTVASQSSDPLRMTSLELLRLLLPTRTACAARCNGVKVAFDAILDPACKDMAEPLMLAILHVFSNPKTRK